MKNLPFTDAQIIAALEPRIQVHSRRLKELTAGTPESAAVAKKLRETEQLVATLRREAR